MNMATEPTAPTMKAAGQSSVATMKKAALVIPNNPGTMPELPDSEATKSNTLCRKTDTMKPRTDA